MLTERYHDVHLYVHVYIYTHTQKYFKLYGEMGSVNMFILVQKQFKSLQKAHENAYCEKYARIYT